MSSRILLWSSGVERLFLLLLYWVERGTLSRFLQCVLHSSFFPLFLLLRHFVHAPDRHFRFLTGESSFLVQSPIHPQEPLPGSARLAGSASGHPHAQLLHADMVARDAHATPPTHRRPSETAHWDLYRHIYREHAHKPLPG